MGEKVRGQILYFGPCLLKALPMNVSERLRQEIVESGHTHYRVWKESGASSRIIDRFVDGTADIRVSTVDRLCEYFGLELRPKNRETAGRQAAKKPATKRKRPKKNAD